jgi:hypothetical protein
VEIEILYVNMDEEMNVSLEKRMRHHPELNLKGKHVGTRFTGIVTYDANLKEWVEKIFDSFDQHIGTVRNRTCLELIKAVNHVFGGRG